MHLLLPFLVRVSVCHFLPPVRVGSVRASSSVNILHTPHLGTSTHAYTLATFRILSRLKRQIGTTQGGADGMLVAATE
ncbi:unnamed protein product [Protopolystoma xenopodis]|uniref:Secreted protein n=1 Tax=Protopolystoma xenopodis TaxID=117903 RepID=A0A448WB10_9PLAT|nr:unnamed protein product [Protopolystoma xenopodis]